MVQVLERRVEWQNIEATLKETHKVLVHDIVSDMAEELDFRDRVIGMQVGLCGSICPLSALPYLPSSLLTAKP